MLESSKNNLIKIGSTINDPEYRRLFTQRHYNGDIGRCQVCLEHRVLLQNGCMPEHRCPGSFEFPIEVDVSISKSYLIELKKKRKSKTGSAKGTITRKINNLEKKINQMKNFSPEHENWQTKVVYLTDEYEKVEKLAHNQLENYRDINAPNKEIFSCSLQEAIVVVEKILYQLGIFEKVFKGYPIPQISNEKMLPLETPKREPAMFQCLMCNNQWKGMTNDINECTSCKTHLFSRCID